MNQEEMKKAAAFQALDYVPNNCAIGVGTGSTTNYFIEALVTIRSRIEGAVPSSEASAEKCREQGIPIVDLNSAADLQVYVDGADEINSHMQMIKGGGGALTREKIIASVAKEFVCIADESKQVDVLGGYPLAIEVISMARSSVGRAMLKLGGDPEYREGFQTDNGNVIIDVHNLNIIEPIAFEQQINNIPGVVCCGLFALRPADIFLMGTAEGGVKVRRRD